MTKRLIAIATTVLFAFTLALAQETKKEAAPAKAAAKAAETVKAVRKTVKLESLPATTQENIKKAVGTGKLTRLVEIKEGDKVIYEAQVVSGTSKSTLRFDANGNEIK